MSLENLPGVGPALARRIRARFGSDDRFLAAVEALDLQAVASVPGLSERRAVALMRVLRGEHAGDGFLATPAARRVRDDIMQRLLACAATDAGRNRLRLLAPHADEHSAMVHLEHVLRLKEQARTLDHDELAGLLRRVHTLARPKPRTETSLLVVAEDAKVHERLHALGVGSWAVLGGPRELREADGFDLVVVVYDEGTLDAGSVGNAVEVAAGAGLAAYCPHAVIGPLEQQRGILEACAELGDRLGRPSAAARCLEVLAACPTGDAVDPRTVRRTVESLRGGLDAEIEARCAELALAGSEVLRAMATGDLPGPLRTVVEDVLRDGHQRLRDATGLAVRPFQATLPVQVDEDELEKALRRAVGSDAARCFDARSRAAAGLQALLPALHDEIAAWQAFDAELALGWFALRHDLGPFRFADDLAFTGSVHLGLGGHGDAQPVGYHLGTEHTVAVLTGANSGGKSTLLEHIAQIAILARMGLPVPGHDVRVPWFDEVHLVTSNRGLDAGAFETFLRGFLPIVQGDARRLVLADEVESVTEPGAAGRILAWVLDRLATTKSLAVVVTHMAPQVLAHVRTATVRVDGIEATGLDGDARLSVDRQPRIGHYARSTPELIVQRLARTTKGPEQALYAGLLQAFDGHDEAAASGAQSS